MSLNKIFYFIKPLIPRSLQILLRRILIFHKLSISTDIWPIDFNSAKLPENWMGWPDQKKFALVLTHDVESAKGQKKCYDLMKMEKDLGFRSVFNFVPERYDVSHELRRFLVSNGFEIGVHGLYHDGKLYKSKDIFEGRAQRINHYLKKWNAVGFRSPAMHHNFEWIHQLKIEYDSSTFDTDPFEPQSDGVGTIFPFWVKKNHIQKGYVELPYTLPQDHLIFILMREKNITIWKNKLDWIAKKGGMVLVNTHPDYMNYNCKETSLEEYPAENYKTFLKYIKKEYNGRYWHVLPKEITHFWRRYKQIVTG